jgi:hypothetical protein
MVSSAIASVDAWIQQAEDVLAELREQGLSPSSAPRYAPRILETMISFGGFAQGLKDLLRALCERPGRWILIAEDALRPHHFWQALCYEDGSLFVEVVSNYYLDGDDRLTDLDGHWLVTHGWKVPVPPEWPNWSRVEDTTSPAVGEVARQAVEAMVGVFGLGTVDLVLTNLFPSDHRGHRHLGTVVTPDSMRMAVTATPSGKPVLGRPPIGGTEDELREWARAFVNEALGPIPADSGPVGPQDDFRDQVGI